MEQLLQKFGPWALVTGASSGIGEEFARQLGALGFNLVITARRADRLERLAAEIGAQRGVDVRPVMADLSGMDFLPALRSATHGLEIGLLVNNAGFSIFGEFLDNDLDRELQLLHVNCRAALVLAHEYGKDMAARRRGGIIFVSSIAGFTPCPHWTHYGVSKAYLLRLAECLADEFKEAHVDVMALCPGGTNTEFQQVGGADSRRGPLLARLAFGSHNPSQVVSTGLNNLGRRTVVIPGRLNQFMVRGMGLLPRQVGMRIAAWVIQKMSLAGRE
jgi:hypothetical protein